MLSADSAAKQSSEQLIAAGPVVQRAGEQRAGGLRHHLRRQGEPADRAVIGPAEIIGPGDRQQGQHAADAEPKQGRGELVLGGSRRSSIIARQPIVRTGPANSHRIADRQPPRHQPAGSALATPDISENRLTIVAATVGAMPCSIRLAAWCRLTPAWTG